MKRMIGVALALAGLLEAKDFGQRGPLFPIEEENLEEVFRKAGSEGIEEYLTQMQEKIRRPDPVGLSLATEEKSQLIDLPGYSAKMLFIDGDDPRQVAWAREQGGEFLWLLVKGSPADLEEEEGREIFFDRMGLYASRLKIREIPAKAVPEGGKVRVTQTPVKG